LRYIGQVPSAATVEFSYGTPWFNKVSGKVAPTEKILLINQ
jgi:hypothetical protein